MQQRRNVVTQLCRCYLFAINVAIEFDSCGNFGHKCLSPKNTVNILYFLNNFRFMFVILLLELHFFLSINYLCFRTSLVAQTVKHLPTMRETWVRSLGWEDPLEKEMVTHSSTLAWRIHGWRSLVGYSPWGSKELDTTEQLHFHFPFTYVFNTNYFFVSSKL